MKKVRCQLSPFSHTQERDREFQADSDRRSIQELNGTIESQRREIDDTLAGDEINNFFMNHYQNKNWIFVKLI